jgi:hypothetical protein
MRTKVTLFLVFLNVALFFYIFRFEQNWQTERERIEKGSLVLGAAAANLQTIEISGPALPVPIDLVHRGNEGWFVAKPFDWPANVFAVNSLLNALGRLEHETAFTAADSDLARNGLTLASYGLAQPRLSVTFSQNEDGTGAQTLQVGDATKDGKRLYVLSPDRKWIHVVSNRLAEVLTKPADQLRSDSLFNIPVTEVSSLRIRTPANQTSVIDRDAANRWQFRSPIRARASDQAALRAVTGLTSLRVKAFPPNPPADATNFSLSINLTGNNRTEKLNLGARVARPAGAADPTGDAEYYATLETTRRDQLVTSTPFLVVVPMALEKLLQNPTQEMREPRLFPDLDPRAVTALTLAGPGAAPLTLQRLEAAAGAPPAWHVVLNQAAPASGTPSADAAVIDRLIARLAELKAVAFVTEAPNSADLENWGFNQPERTVALTLAGGQAPAKLELGYDRDRRVVRARFVGGESTTIFEVRPEIVTDASLQPLDYRNRLLRELPSGARLTRVKLTDLTAEPARAVLLEQNLTDPAAPPPSAPVADLLRQLQTLRAAGFVSDRFAETVRIDNTDRPWRYRLEADIALTAGVGSTSTSTTTLQLSERTAGNVQYAGSQEFGAVWLLEQPLIDALWQIVGPPAGSVAPGRSGP